jgi:hypothetical protein
VIKRSVLILPPERGSEFTCAKERHEELPRSIDVRPRGFLGSLTIATLESEEQLMVTEHGVILGKPRAKECPPEAQIVQEERLGRIP